MMAAAGIGFGPDVESVRMTGINLRLGFLKRVTEDMMQFIEECGTESKTHETEVEVTHKTPGDGITCTALRDKAVNMGVPLQIAAESMKDEDEAGSKVLRLVEFTEHAEDDAGNSVKEAVQKGTVFQEEDTKLFRDGKDAVTVGAVKEL